MAAIEMDEAAQGAALRSEVTLRPHGEDLKSEETLSYIPDSGR